MSNKKISELTENTSPETDVQIPIVNDPDGSPETQRTSFANLLKKQNQGIGSSYSASGSSESIVYTGVSLTDPVVSMAGYRVKIATEYTTNTSLLTQALHAEHTPIINSGITNSGDVYGAAIRCMRNRIAADSDDDGTLNDLRGLFIHYGHDDFNAAATPITTNVYGLNIYAENSTGTINVMTDLYIWSHPSLIAPTSMHFSINQVDSNTVNYFAGQSNLNNAVIQKYTVTIDDTDGADTYTAAQLLGKIIRRGTGDELTGTVVDVTDTAANIVAAILNCRVGSGFEFTVQNEDSTHTIQVDGGTGVTMLPNDPSTAIPANSSARFAVVVTTKTVSSEAVDIHCIGIALH